MNENTIDHIFLSDECYAFLQALCNAGFGDLSFSTLCQFHDWIIDRFGYTPLPWDENWEEVLNFAEEIFVGD